MGRGLWLPGILAAVVVCVVSAASMGDDTEAGWNGDDLLPVQSKTIRMASEEVDVEVSWSKSKREEDRGVLDWHCPMHVTGSWLLVNDSDKAQSILVSFPNNFGVSKFARTVDGKPVKVEEHPGTDYRFASKIDFAPRQERRVRVTYTGYSENSSGGSGNWEYILTTGANWKGNIGKAIVRIHFPKEMPPGGAGPFNFEAVKMTPEGYSIEGRTTTWEFVDFKPKDDICIMWDGIDALLASDAFQLESKAEASALLLEQGRMLKKSRGDRAVKAFATIREFFPNSKEAKVVDFYMGDALSEGIFCGELSELYGNEAVARFEAALRGPLEEEQRKEALCRQFIMCSVEVRDKAKARGLIGRLKETGMYGECSRGLCRWGNEWVNQYPHKAVRAFEAIREFFPDSPEDKAFDYYMARAYGHHEVNDMQTNHMTLKHMGFDAAKAVKCYETALKEPLEAEQRNEALAELFMMYSIDFPDAVKAGKAFELLRKGAIGSDARHVLLKVAGVSPQKALELIDMVTWAEAAEKTYLQGELKEMQGRYPKGLVEGK